MAQYKVGDKVIREDSGKKGVVVEVLDAPRGRQLYMVNWGETTNEALEVELIPDCDISNPYERCANAMNLLRRILLLKSGVQITALFPLLKLQRLCSALISSNLY